MPGFGVPGVAGVPAGADAVVLGTPMALAAEALGEGWFWPAAAAHPSLPRGALLQVAIGERPPLRQVLTGPSDDPFGSLNLVGGLRRSMAKAGYCDLKEFQKVGLNVETWLADMIAVGCLQAVYRRRTVFT